MQLKQDEETNPPNCPQKDTSPPFQFIAASLPAKPMSAMASSFSEKVKSFPLFVIHLFQQHRTQTKHKQRESQPADS